MCVNLMKFAVRIRTEAENVFRNSGCVMVIGRNIVARRRVDMQMFRFLGIVMMEVMNNNAIAVKNFKKSNNFTKIIHSFLCL